MKKSSSIKIDDYGKGLLVGLISRALSDDQSLTSDDIAKLKEIKKQLQEVSN